MYQKVSVPSGNVHHSHELIVGSKFESYWEPIYKNGTDEYARTRRIYLRDPYVEKERSEVMKQR
jgi:hypothetical protein